MHTGDYWHFYEVQCKIGTYWCWTLQVSSQPPFYGIGTCATNQGWKEIYQEEQEWSSWDLEITWRASTFFSNECSHHHRIEPRVSQHEGGEFWFFYSMSGCFWYQVWEIQWNIYCWFAWSNGNQFFEIDDPRKYSITQCLGKLWHHLCKYGIWYCSNLWPVFQVPDGLFKTAGSGNHRWQYEPQR